MRVTLTPSGTYRTAKRPTVALLRWDGTAWVSAPLSSIPEGLEPVYRAAVALQRAR